MNEQYVEERIRQYSKTRIFYEEFAEQVLGILKAIVKQEYPDIKIAFYSKRAKGIESLRKKLRKDKYNKDSEITDLAGVRIITYSKKERDLMWIQIEYVKNIISVLYRLEERTMDKGRQFFGYDEEQIRDAFRNSKDQVDTNSKIDDTLTLSQLVEYSGRLLKENKEFLHMIYNDLDE